MQQGMTISDIKVTIAPLFMEWESAPALDVVQSEAELPTRVQEKIRGLDAWGDVCGIFDDLDEAVYLVANNIDTPEIAERVVLQEVVGHYGLSGILGDEMTIILKEVCRAMPTRVREVAAKCGWDLRTEEGKLESAAELIGEMALAGEEAGVLGRAFGKVRGWMRRMGFRVSLSEKDVRVLVAESGRFARKGGKSITRKGSIFIKRRGARASKERVVFRENEGPGVG